MSLQPLFTLRGHNTGVTALTQIDFDGEACLVSGDQEGTVIFWDLVTFKQITSHQRLCNSQIQSIRVIQLECAENLSTVLVVQSRNNGLSLFHTTRDKLVHLANYDTYEALFSRGDAISRHNGTAVLAYPSCLNNHFVTVRLLGAGAKTILSGSAQRFQEDDSKKGSLFDIKVKQDNSSYLLFVAYEDATICAFSLNLQDTLHVPVLDSRGIKIEMVKKFGLDFKDFITSLDVRLVDDKYNIICGAPTNNVYVIATPRDLRSPQVDEVDQIKLKKRGVSTIATYIDCDIAAIACWDSSIVLYSLNSKNPLKTLSNHTKQVQDLIFLDGSKIYEEHHDSPEPKPHGPSYANKLLLCCASMDGTISLTYIR